MSFGILMILITCFNPALSSKTVITFNAGLFEGVGLGSVPSPPSREARRDAMISELLKLENAADLVCLQEVSGIGQVACVHSTPYGLSGLRFYPEFQIRLLEGIKSYEEQGDAQLTQLVTKFGSNSPVFLLGDFNVGGRVEPDIDPQQLANYQILTSAFQTEQHGECTFCSVEDNAYNNNTEPVVIDHIFYKGWTYSPGSSVRIFDSARVDGLPLSDHFGVKQTFT